MKKQDIHSSDYSNHTYSNCGQSSPSLAAVKSSQLDQQLKLQQQQSKQSTNLSLKDTKYSTSLESQKSNINHSQIEGKSSLFSLQFREINSQQNQIMMEDPSDMLQTNTDHGQNYEEENEDTEGFERQEKGSKVHGGSNLGAEGFQIDQIINSNIRGTKSMSLNCPYTFGNNIMNEEESEDFRTSLLTATKNSRMNRDKLRKDLIKSNIIQQNDISLLCCDTIPYDDEEEAENMFPIKGKSMLISINNINQGQTRGISSNKREECQPNQQFLNMMEQGKRLLLQQPAPSKASDLINLPDQKRRRSSSTHQVKIPFSSQEINVQQSGEASERQEESKSGNDIQKSNVILASTQSLPSEVHCESFKQKKSSEVTPTKMSQAQIVAMKLNQEEKDELEAEYYDEDYYQSTRKGQNSHKYDIKFHKSFFTNDNINQRNNISQSIGINGGRSREQTENLQFNTEINHFTTSESRNFDVRNSIKISEKLEKMDAFHQRLSYKEKDAMKNEMMRLSITTYDQQTIGGAISLQTFMETKQNIVLQDWIQKRSSNIIVGWQKRWLVLKNKKLQYFKGQDSNHYQGCIDFSILNCSLQRVENKKKQLIEIRVSIDNSSKVFRFQSSKLGQVGLERWAQEISKQIESSQQRASVRPRHVTLQREFWKNDRVCLNEFESLADTGDLILFKGKTFGEKVIRNLIHCEYNHIGLVLRTNNNSNNLLILEATGEEGVGLLSWKTFLKRNWQDLYHKISLRKLIAERTDDMLTKMEQFIRYAIGKQYKVSFSKLFKKKTEGDEDLIEDPNRTFFCSELIASIYKTCGFLPLDISSGNYWPSSFEGSRNLKLINNAYLSEEFILDFDI